MATMTIRNMPEELLERLKTVAKEHRRSLNQQVLVWLEECVEPSEEERDVEAELREISKLRRGAGSMTTAKIDAAKRVGRA